MRDPFSHSKSPEPSFFSGPRWHRLNQIASQWPIYPHLGEIVHAVRNHQCTIVTSSTGTGKTSLVPAALLANGFQPIVCVPHKLSAERSAGWLASLMNDTPGGLVGYATSEVESLGPLTRAVFCTDGLGQRFEEHPNFSQNPVFILDEVHERSSMIDMLMGLTKLRGWHVVIMSATVDTEKFASFFTEGGQSPAIVPVRGSLHPVVSRPPSRSLVMDIVRGITDGHEVMAILDSKVHIQQVARAIRNFDLNVELLEFYGGKTNAELDRCFARHQRPRVILSSVMGQSNFTFPGITYLVDSGVTRLVEVEGLRHAIRSVPTTQAESLQRRGRLGRTGPGIYVDHNPTPFDERPFERPPEICRTSLESFYLKLAAQGVPMEELPLVDHPGQSSVVRAKSSLTSIGFLHSSGHITQKGREALRLPFSPIIASMVIEGERRGVRGPMLALAAILQERGLVFKEASGWRELVPPIVRSELIAQWAALARSIKEQHSPSQSRQLGFSVKAMHKIRTTATRIARRIGVDESSLWNYTDSIEPELRRCLAQSLAPNLSVRSKAPKTFKDLLGHERKIDSHFISDNEPVIVSYHSDVSDIEGERLTVELPTAVDRQWLPELFRQQYIETFVDLRFIPTQDKTFARVQFSISTGVDSSPHTATFPDKVVVTDPVLSRRYFVDWLTDRFFADRNKDLGDKFLDPAVIAIRTYFEPLDAFQRVKAPGRSLFSIEHFKVAVEAAVGNASTLAEVDATQFQSVVTELLSKIVVDSVIVPHSIQNAIVGKSYSHRDGSVIIEFSADALNGALLAKIESSSITSTHKNVPISLAVLVDGSVLSRDTPASFADAVRSRGKQAKKPATPIPLAPKVNLGTPARPKQEAEQWLAPYMRVPESMRTAYREFRQQIDETLGFLQERRERVSIFVSLDCSSLRVVTREAADTRLPLDSVSSALSERFPNVKVLMTNITGDRWEVMSLLKQVVPDLLVSKVKMSSFGVCSIVALNPGAVDEATRHLVKRQLGWELLVHPDTHDTAVAFPKEYRAPTRERSAEIERKLASLYPQGSVHAESTSADPLGMRAGFIGQGSGDENLGAVAQQFADECGLPLLFRVYGTDRRTHVERWRKDNIAKIPELSRPGVGVLYSRGGISLELSRDLPFASGEALVLFKNKVFKVDPEVKVVVEPFSWSHHRRLIGTLGGVSVLGIDQKSNKLVYFSDSMPGARKLRDAQVLASGIGQSLEVRQAPRGVGRKVLVNQKKFDLSLSRAEAVSQINGIATMLHRSIGEVWLKVEPFGYIVHHAPRVELSEALLAGLSDIAAKSPLPLIFEPSPFEGHFEVRETLGVYVQPPSLRYLDGTLTIGLKPSSLIATHTIEEIVDLTTKFAKSPVAIELIGENPAPR